MIQKITLLLLLSLTCLANDLIQENMVSKSMLQLAKPKTSSHVYLGSFLAQGHLPAHATYRIDTPVEGIIEKMSVSIYEKITKGDLLALIKSPKILELESIYINLLIEEEYNANELKRLEPLYKAAIVAKKQYLKAQNTLAKYNAQVKFYYNLLQEWGLSTTQIEKVKNTKKPIPEIKIYAPISGKITELNIFPKMYLQRGEHMLTIVQEDETHIEVALPLSLAKKLQVGFELYINKTPVKIEAIAAQIAVRTQTLAVHLLTQKSMFILPNEKKNIKLFWPKKAYILPASSLINHNDKTALFIKVDKGYQLVYIDVLGRDSQKIYCISKELSTETLVVVDGTISLKGVLQGQDND